MTPRQPTRRLALTLLEVLLSLSILVVLSAMTYWFYDEALRTRERDLRAADKVRLARVILDRMATEIRQASVETADAGIGIEGDKEAIRIASVRLPARRIADTRFSRVTPPPEYDLIRVEYRIARHPDILHPEENYEFPLGLARVETSIPRAEDPNAVPAADESILQQDASGRISLDPSVLDSLLGGAAGEGTGLETDVNWQELYAEEIRYLRFCYYDGASWWDDWRVTGENPLPQLVQVTIGFEPHPICGEEFGEDEDNVEFCECMNREPPDCKPLPPDQYSMMVRVTPADPLFRSRVSREGQDLVEKATKSAADSVSGGQP